MIARDPVCTTGKDFMFSDKQMDNMICFLSFNKHVYLKHKGFLEEGVWLPASDRRLATRHLLATAADQT
jgi:hypothetical protein